MTTFNQNLDDDPVIGAIRAGIETRWTEFKESQPFEVLKWKLVKACMAMANTRDGGRVIIGFDERNDMLRASGMSKEVQATYTQDALFDLVNRHARPPVNLTLRKLDYEGLLFVGIEILPFKRTPVICIKNSTADINSGRSDLKSGEIYARSEERIATTKCVTPELLEELLESAALKRAAEFVANAKLVGFALPGPNDEAQFGAERDDFGWGF